MSEFQQPDSSDFEASSTSDDVRTRIISAANDLLTAGGRDALTTRAVSTAAGVQAPTIYRMFGDKQGLLEAVAEYGFAKYLVGKQARQSVPDLIEDMRAGWDMHVGFGLANPALFSLMFGEPRPGRMPRAAATSFQILREHMRRIAVAGRLRISEIRAAHLVHAAACGTVLTLLAMHEDDRDIGLSHVAREAVIAAITTEAPLVENPSPSTAAIVLRATLPDATSLTPAERQLMEEWLERIVVSGLS